DDRHRVHQHEAGEEAPAGRADDVCKIHVTEIRAGAVVWRDTEVAYDREDGAEEPGAYDDDPEAELAVGEVGRPREDRPDERGDRARHRDERPEEAELPRVAALALAGEGREARPERETEEVREEQQAE